MYFCSTLTVLTHLFSQEGLEQSALLVGYSEIHSVAYIIVFELIEKHYISRKKYTKKYLKIGTLFFEYL